MKKACVIGWPIKHSRSPLIHNYWLEKYQIAGLYECRAIEPRDLKEFIRAIPGNGYVGCNVTIPHKESALAYVDQFDECVAKTSSLNTIYFKDRKICATSTDGDGFLNNIARAEPTFVFDQKNILLIGAGGSAKAICERLLRANVKNIYVQNRTPARIKELQRIFGEKIGVVSEATLESQMKQADLLINTTSQGMTGQPALHIDLRALLPHALVADIVYVPLKTDLILQAEARGLRTVSGLGMLLHQAVEGFNHWFGMRPQVTQELFDLVANDILAELHQ